MGFFLNVFKTKNCLYAYFCAISNKSFTEKHITYNSFIISSWAFCLFVFCLFFTVETFSTFRPPRTNGGAFSYFSSNWVQSHFRRGECWQSSGKCEHFLDFHFFRVVGSWGTLQKGDNWCAFDLRENSFGVVPLGPRAREKESSLVGWAVGRCFCLGSPSSPSSSPSSFPSFLSFLLLFLLISQSQASVPWLLSWLTGWFVVCLGVWLVWFGWSVRLSIDVSLSDSVSCVVLGIWWIIFVSCLLDCLYGWLFNCSICWSGLTGCIAYVAGLFFCAG